MILHPLLPLQDTEFWKKNPFIFRDLMWEFSLFKQTKKPTTQNCIKKNIYNTLRSTCHSLDFFYITWSTKSNLLSACKMYSYWLHQKTYSLLLELSISKQNRFKRMNCSAVDCDLKLKKFKKKKTRQFFSSFVLLFFLNWYPIVHPENERFNLTSHYLKMHFFHLYLLCDGVCDKKKRQIVTLYKNRLA